MTEQEQEDLALQAVASLAKDGKSSFTEEEFAERVQAIWIGMALEENCRLGFMERVGDGDDGNGLYRLTDAGRQHVESMKRKDER